MKTKLLTALCVVTLLLSSATRVRAYDNYDSLAQTGDALIARPGGLVATAVGSVLFVITLPFMVGTKRVKQSADVLVVKPAKFTFSRPLGKFDWSD